MKKLEQVLVNSKENKWPYPKTFEALIEAGVTSYTVNFKDEFAAVFYGDFGTYQEPALPGFHPLKIAKAFSAQGVKESIIKHTQAKTSYLEFIADIASQGASHYVVDMPKRKITYYNPDESESHIENVPVWSQ
jgi:uncharacterized protein YbcV (DUF1398 family)